MVYAGDISQDVLVGKSNPMEHVMCATTVFSDVHAQTWIQGTPKPYEDVDIRPQVTDAVLQYVCNRH